ncbi:MAG TPA: molybdopterin-binding protein, partial [Novosphingobium sp.]
MADPDTPQILREASRRLDLPARRLFLRQALGLGTIGLLTGCKVVDGFSAERALSSVSDFNDRAQAWLFDPSRLAREYPESAIT